MHLIDFKVNLFAYWWFLHIALPPLLTYVSRGVVT
jgi:hypothetical protein